MAKRASLKYHRLLNIERLFLNISKLDIARDIVSATMRLIEMLKKKMDVGFHKRNVHCYIGFLFISEFLEVYRNVCQAHILSSSCSGTFGRIFHGTLIEEKDPSKEKQVFVKTVKGRLSLSFIIVTV